MDTATREPGSFFNIDESLFGDNALHGLLSLDDMSALEDEWKAAKIDEWCAVTALTGAANAVRRVAALPPVARFGYVLNAAMNKALDGDLRAAAAVQRYRDAQVAYRNATFTKTSIRARAHADA